MYPSILLKDPNKKQPLSPSRKVCLILSGWKLQYIYNTLRLEMASHRITQSLKIAKMNVLLKLEACQTDMSGRGCIMISLSILPFLSVAEH